MTVSLYVYVDVRVRERGGEAMATETPGSLGATT